MAKRIVEIIRAILDAIPSKAVDHFIDSYFTFRPVLKKLGFDQKMDLHFIEFEVAVDPRIQTIDDRILAYFTRNPFGLGPEEARELAKKHYGCTEIGGKHGGRSEAGSAGGG